MSGRLISSFGFFLLLLVMVSSPWSMASELAFSRNARTFETQQSSLVTKALAHSCLTLFNVPDGLPCNPAMTAFTEDPSLGVEVLLSNGYSSLNNVRKLLDNEVTEEFVDSLFSENKVLQIEGNGEVNFVSKYFNARYTPMTLKGFAVLRNEANPDIELYTTEEKGFQFQSGYEAFKDLYVGLQVRFVDRKFIRKRFQLAELGTDEGKNLLAPKTQSATYVEPGLTWVMEPKWKTRVALMVANLGFVSEEYPELPVPVELQAGLAVSPPLKWGNLDLSFEFRSMNYEESFAERLRAGFLYHFGAMYLAGGVDANGISGGIYYTIEKINAGVLYSTTQYVNADDDFYTQTVYVQLGWQI